MKMRTCLAAIGVAVPMVLASMASPVAAAPTDAARGEKVRYALVSGVPLAVASPTRWTGGVFELVDGLTYHVTEGDGATETDRSALPAVNVLFDYTLDVSYGIYSREWKTTTGRVCNKLTLRELRDEDPREPVTNDLWVYPVNSSNKRVGAAVSWPYDDSPYNYCWLGLTIGTTYKMWFGFGGGGGHLYVGGNGTMSG